MKLICEHIRHEIRIVVKPRNISFISGIKEHRSAGGRMGVDVGGRNEVAFGVGLGSGEKVEVVEGLVVGVDGVGGLF